MAYLHFILLLSLVAFSSQSADLQGKDFCVADTASPAGLTGKACKDPTKVTADDFMYSSALAVPGNTTNLLKVSFAAASVNQLPGLNGLGVSLARADFASGGGFPMHTHTHSELILVMEGTVEAGFIAASSNAVYYKTLKAGDVFAIPPGHLHWARNPSDSPSSVIVAFSSPSLVVQLLTSALFGNNLPTEVVQATTFLDAAQIAKLKGMFGGTN